MLANRLLPQRLMSWGPSGTQKRSLLLSSYDDEARANFLSRRHSWWPRFLAAAVDLTPDVAAQPFSLSSAAAVSLYLSSTFQLDLFFTTLSCAGITAQQQLAFLLAVFMQRAGPHMLLHSFVTGLYHQQQLQPGLSARYIWSKEEGYALIRVFLSPLWLEKNGGL